MKTLGVILARRGSVGLANKHLRLLLGRPVIEYTFDHAFGSALLEQVVVSTDCPGIARLAHRYKLESIDRPAALAGGDASVQDVMLHALQVTEASGGWRADALVVIYGNVPVRGSGVIDAAIELLRESGCDSVRSFCPVGKWNPGWMARLSGSGESDSGYRVEPLQGGSVHRRQDLAPLYLHDGAVVAVTRAALLRGVTNPSDPHAFFGEDRRAIITGAGETVEVDQERDLFWAEAVLREREAMHLRQPMPTRLAS
jgi:CMP-N-acetylneuraminic acid synthetase